MKKIEMNAKTFQLPECTTQEALECRWNHVLKFGDRILLAGYYYSCGDSNWFGTVYRFTTDDQTCEGQIELREVSQEFFEDEGHAIAWAMAKRGGSEQEALERACRIGEESVKGRVCK